jgi:GAF domain-containing protein
MVAVMATNTALLSKTFVQLADSLVDEFDIIELLTLLSHRCVELFGVAAAGILLGDQRGTLQVVAASTEQSRLLELFQLQNDEGPCLECFSTGVPVIAVDLAQRSDWPLFAREALASGFRAVHAYPLRLRNEVVGTLNVFLVTPGEPQEEEGRLCQALADVATIAILQNQATKRVETVNAQLQFALDSRVTIEQAKGILAERMHVGMTEAFERLRGFARVHNLQLGVVAADVVAGTSSLIDPVTPLEVPPPATGDKAT